MFHTYNLNRAAPLAPGVRLNSSLDRDEGHSYVNDQPFMVHRRDKVRRNLRLILRRLYRN